MTVKELKKILEGLPDSTIVCMDNYILGYRCVNDVIKYNIGEDYQKTQLLVLHHRG